VASSASLAAARFEIHGWRRRRLVALEVPSTESARKGEHGAAPQLHTPRWWGSGFYLQAKRMKADRSTETLFALIFAVCVLTALVLLTS